MIRAAVAVVAGYAALFIVIFVSFSGAYLVMGPDRAFKPGSYEVSGAWLALSLVLGLVGAAVGGLVCALVAGPASRAPGALAAALLVLGLAIAVPSLGGGAEPGEPRPAGPCSLDAMGKARTPAAAAVLNPFIGAAGVVGGARLRRPGLKAGA